MLFRSIYRSQASLAPGIKVRMGTKALPHAGIGVACYAWSTSPLRRYTDLVNQWQIVACVRHGATAALAAPFQPKSAELLSIISSFETAYSAYNAHQAQMERFWTLRYLQQASISTLEATVIKAWPDQPVLVRADALPLVLTVTTSGLQRGQRLRLQLGQIDAIGLDVRASVLDYLDADAAATPDTGEEGDEDLSQSGPIQVDIDLSDAAPLATGGDAA
mgnify:FL=1